MSDHPPTVEVGPIDADVAAPAALLFQMLRAIGQGAQRPGERAEILGRDGDALVCDFWTIVSLPFGRTRSVRTRERVRLVPPARVEYVHLDGPVRGLRESITIEPIDDRRSRLVYRGTYAPRGRLAGHAFRSVSRGAIERAVRDHFADLRERAEARAARSRIFQGDDAPRRVATSGAGVQPADRATAAK